MAPMTLAKPTNRTIDDELQEAIARHAAAHHIRAEKRHYAETGLVEPIDEEQEAAEELATLLRMARPELDGDEQAALLRLKDALEKEDAAHH